MTMPNNRRRAIRGAFVYELYTSLVTKLRHRKSQNVPQLKLDEYWVYVYLFLDCEVGDIDRGRFLSRDRTDNAVSPSYKTRKALCGCSASSV